MNNTDKEPPFEKLEASLGRLLKRAPDLPVSSVLLSRIILHLGRGMANMLHQQIRPFGLAEADFRVLMTLYSQPEGVAHPSDLCAHTEQSPANMSRIADALVTREFITREPSQRDRRRMVLRITGRGEVLVQELLPLLFGPLRETFSDVSDEDQRWLIVVLKRLGAKLEEALARGAAPRSS